MRIELSTRASAGALADYLQRCECSVVFVDECTLDVRPPRRSQNDREGDTEIDGYLRVWLAMHPGDYAVLIPHTAD
jgi:hypothetical protein